MLSGMGEEGEWSSLVGGVPVGYCLQMAARHRSSQVPDPSQNRWKRGTGLQEGIGRDATWREEPVI